MNQAYAKFDLTGKTAFITGGGTGLGYFMSRGLARSGAKVMISSRREDVLQKAAAELTQAADGNQVVYKSMDMSDRNSVAHAAEFAIETLGGVDIFIGNAGVDSHERVDDITDAALHSMLDTNLAGNIALVRSFLPHMRKQHWGRVIFSSSVAGTRAAAEDAVAVYSMVKAALNSFARSGAGEAGHDGITFNSLNLGIFQTDIFMNFVNGLEQAGGPGTRDKYVRNLSSNIALGRLGDADEVEGLVQLLASNAGSYITGANLAIDGGISIMLKPNPVKE